MSLFYYGTVVLAFIAGAFLCEALWQWWFSTQSKAARRFNRRLRDQAAGGPEPKGGSLLKQRRLADADGFDEFLRGLPGVASLDVLLQQAGSSANVGRMLLLSLAGGGAGLFIGKLMTGSWLLAAGFGLVAALLPIANARRLRGRRLRLFETQLPEAADMISRSLRAGHALPSTLQMVAAEMPEPIAGEFRIVSDEVTYGLGLVEALHHFAERVPLEDLRFLVIAILIQRETGGNLAELTENMARLMRERQKLLGQVRAYSAEGRLSGLILFMLPIAMALVLSLMNPGYLGVMVDDEFGRMLLGAAALMQVAGGWWMHRIVQLRV